MRQVAGRYSVAVLLACAAMAFSGCGTGNGDAPGEDTDGIVVAPGADAPLALIVARVTERECGILAACCADAAFPYDEQGCKAIHQTQIFPYFQAQTFLGAELDTEAAQRCLDSIGKLSDGCPVDRKDGLLTDACARVFKGSVPLGGACDESHGCATTPDNPLICDIDEDSYSENAPPRGVCVAITPRTFVHGSAGQACSNTCLGNNQDLCTHDGPEGTCYTGDGLFCSTETNRCEPQVASGEPCSSGDQCATGTYCNHDDAKCEPLRPLGAPCSAQSQCADNNYCTSGTCQVPPRVTAE